MRSIVPRSVGPWLAVVTLTAAGAAAAVGYGLTAPKRYRATAQLLVAPVSVSDPTFVGLDVLRDTGGRRTAAATAAALLRSPQVADSVRAQLGLPRSRDSLLAALHPHVVDSSDIVAVTVEDTSAAGAAQLANAFADALVKQRTAGFQSQLATTIRRDQQLLQGIPTAQRTSGTGALLNERLIALHGFEGQPDPTIRHAAEAAAPASASWPRLPRLAAAGAGAGLAAGVLVALLLVLGRFGRRATVAGGTAPYDRGVSDRLVARLEERVAERIAALEAERERLSAREAGLAARERDVEQKLGELRAAVETAALAPVSPAGTDELAGRQAELEARIAALTQREVGLARKAAELAARERGLAHAAAEADRSQPPEPEPQSAERQAGLEARIAALTQREVGLARKAAELAARERELEERAHELDARSEELDRAAAEAEEAERSRPPEPEPEAEPEPEPEPVAVAPAQVVPEPVATPGGGWNLMVLEKLVNDRGEEFPERVDEWLSYLYFLREYAEPDGSVPTSFDWLIQDTFSELVA